MLKLIQFGALSSFSWHLCPFDIILPLQVSWTLHYFLALGSSCIFLALVLESAISPKSSGSFYWRMLLEIQDRGACCYWGMSLLLGTLSWQKKIHVWIYIHMDIFINISIYNHYIYIKLKMGSHWCPQL